MTGRPENPWEPADCAPVAVFKRSDAARLASEPCRGEMSSHPCCQSPLRNGMESVEDAPMTPEAPGAGEWAAPFTMESAVEAAQSNGGGASCGGRVNPHESQGGKRSSRLK